MKKVSAVFVTLAALLLGATAQLDTFDYCVRMTPSPGLLHCAGQQAMTSLQFLEEASNFTLANGVLMVKDESLPASRIIPNFVDHDPLDFRGMLENAGAVISQRQLLWDMGLIYPGLKMKIGPTLGASGLLEFVLDPTAPQSDERAFFEEKSTARILTKSFVVPFLLGLKFNLATLLPLVFGGLILLSKKALILGKIALFLSGLFGYGALFQPAFGFSQYGFGGGGYGGYGGGIGIGKPFRYNNPFADSPDYDHQPSTTHHQHHHGQQHDSYHSADDHSSGSYYKKKDKFLNVDERLEPQGSATVDKFYDYEKQQMMKDRTARLFERKFYEKEQQGGAGSLLTGGDYPFVTSDSDGMERNERTLPDGEGTRNFAWSQHK